MHTFTSLYIHSTVHTNIHTFSQCIHSPVYTYIHQSIRTSFPHTSQVLRYDVIRGIWSILEEQIAGSKLTLFWLKILTNAEGLLLPLSPNRFLYYFWRRKKCSASATDVDVGDKCNDIEDRTSKKQSGYCSLKKHWERERESEYATTLVLMITVRRTFGQFYLLRCIVDLIRRRMFQTGWSLYGIDGTEVCDIIQLILYYRCQKLYLQDRPKIPAALYPKSEHPIWFPLQ